LPADIGALPFEAEVFAMNHTVPTLAIRMQLEGKTIAYCPDTGLCENAVQAAKDADLLIAESAYLPGQNYPHWPHLNPESAATLAVRANARKLFLVHFDASRYLSMEDRQNGLKAARKIFDKTELGRDGLVLETGD
jgi:ribonuclease BN (tRNA processing enzyme)